MKVFRQGDVLFIPVNRDFVGIGTEMRRQSGRLIRRGEHGGLHQVSLPSFRNDAKIWLDRSGTKFLTAPNGAAIVHGEHHTLDLPAGNYEVRVQREVGTEGRGIRNVVD